MPDGGIGRQRTVTAGELMTSPVITVSRRTTVGDAAKLMLVNRVGLNSGP